MSSDASAAELTVISRDGCDLCDEMLAGLHDLAQSHPLPPLKVVDVDGDPELVRRFGLKVPVLMLNGSVICHYTLDSHELLRLLKGPAAIIAR